MTEAARTCHKCGGAIGSEEHFWSACEVEADAPSDGRIEFLDGVADPDAVIASRVTRVARRLAAVTGAVATGAVVVVVALLVLSPDDESGNATRFEAEPTSPVVGTAEQGQDRSSAQNTSRVTTTGFGPGYGERLALLVDQTVGLVDLSTGEEVAVDVNGPIRGSAIVVVEERLAFVGEENAFLVDLDGSAVLDLGPAGTVIEASSESSIWVGHQRDQGSDRMTWREVDVDGNELRSTVTALPLDFNQPDLRSGHQSRMLRLTDSESRPWQIVAQGHPIGVGPNDIVLASCDADLNCDRRWFDLGTGADRGPLFADIADNIGERSGGWISPSGRFWLSGAHDDGGVTLLALATGKEIENSCSESSTAQWSRNDSLLACHAEGGVLLYDLDQNVVFRVDRPGVQSFSFVAGSR